MLSKLEALLAQSSKDLRGDAALLADLLSIPTGDSRRDLSPQRRKEKTLAALLAQLVGLANRLPVLVILEDAHWIDPTSLELLERVVERVPRLPLLVVVTARPEFRSPWTGHPHVATRLLNRLSRREGRAMVEEIAGAKTIPREVVDHIVDRTDGVPLFLEELTKAVLESAGLSGEGDRLVLTAPLGSHPVPKTLHASLLARLDRLPSARRTAQAAAAIGREFSHELIGAVCEASQADLSDALQQLVMSELLHRRGAPPDAVYIFKHVLVQDAVYSTLLRAPRQELHARIASVIEERTPGIGVTQPEILAHHCTQGGLIAKAVAYCLKAGQLACSRSANAEAITHLSRGLGLLDKLPPGADRNKMELDLQCVLGPSVITTRGYADPRATAAFERARELMRDLGESSRADAVLTGLSAAYYNRAAYREALKIREELLAFAELHGYPAGLCIACRGIASIHNVFGNFAVARDYGERAWSLYDYERDSPTAWRYPTDIGVAAAAQLAIALWHLGEFARSRQLVEASLALAARLNHHNSVGYALSYASIISLLVRDHATAHAHADALQRVGLEHGLPQWTVWGIGMQALALTALGQAQEALQKFEYFLKMRERMKNEALGAMVCYGYAEVLLGAGRHEEARETIASALLFAKTTGEHWMDSALHCLQGDCLLAADKQEGITRASACYRQGMDTARLQGSRAFEVRAAASLARLMLDDGRKGEARALVAPIVGSFGTDASSPDLQRLGQILEEAID